MSAASDDPVVPDTSQWQWAAMAPELNEREKKLRTEFVKEYLVDGNEVKAAVRVGFQAGFAADYAKKFMTEPFVLQEIERMRQMKVNEKDLDAYDKNIVRDVLRRAAQDVTAPHSTKVQAAIAMAKILGMDKTEEVKHEHTHKGGVLMVPAIANLNDWEQVAAASQAKLVADVRH